MRLSIRVIPGPKRNKVVAGGRPGEGLFDRAPRGGSGQPGLDRGPRSPFSGQRERVRIIRGEENRDEARGDRNGGSQMSRGPTNSKFETRNPKQTRRSKIQMIKTKPYEFSVLGFE